MESSTGVANYIGTLIFCIIVKGISIVVLILLLTNFGQNWQYALLTIEICMISVVMYAIYKIRAYEAEILAKYVSLRTANMELNVCPDYYVKELKNNEIICKSKYETIDKKFVYDMSAGTQSLQEINLTRIGHDGKNTLGGICDIITNTDGDYHSKLSWTDIKSQCE